MILEMDTIAIAFPLWAITVAGGAIPGTQQARNRACGCYLCSRGGAYCPSRC